MAKEKSEGDEFSAIGKQTMARAYSAMDYYFDHLKEDYRLGTVGRNGVRRESKSVLRSRTFPPPKNIVRELSLRQGYPGYTANSDGIHALANGSFWRAG